MKTLNYELCDVQHPHTGCIQTVDGCDGFKVRVVHMPVQYVTAYDEVK